jgi:putative nucleotidyltransferase with HDIG domain
MGEDDARELAKRLLASELAQRWRHVEAVAAEATRLCTALDVDERVVVAAAWLHDIGYAAEVTDTGFHPLDGARYLRSRGWDDMVCQLVAHHTDAMTQAADEGLAAALAAEFDEVGGLARDVLWAADATTGPNGERFTLDERLAEVGHRYGADHPVTRRMSASRLALADAIARVGAAGD